MRLLIFALTALMFFATPVVAGDLKDAVAAYKAGDYQKALRLLKPLAEQGDVDAQSYLGAMYDDGERVPEDDAKAVYWYRKAAEQGDAWAQSRLTPRLILKAVKILKIAEDYRQAFSLLEPLAKDGNKKALHQPGVMYAKGQGIAQSDVKAYVCWSAAAHRGYPKSQEARDTLATYMSERDLAKAKKLAGEYWKKYLLK
tara:strand:+ start:1446 stop:2042 length:597 start_codon:yes stop_codon:yes gene_type:complete